MAKATILFVDDDPRVTDSLKRTMRRMPYDVLTADSAKAGMNLLATHSVDVVVSDERMPGISGAEFVAWVRKNYPDTVRIILSGQADLDAAIKAINEGEIYRFLVKPCSAADLHTTIYHALQQQRLIKQSRSLLREYQKQLSVLVELERSNPGITSIDTDPQGAIWIDESDATTDIGTLLVEIEHELNRELPKPDA